MIVPEKLRWFPHLVFGLCSARLSKIRMCEFWGVVPYLTFSCPFEIVVCSARDAIKLALLGVGHPVDWWGLPIRPEWALIPDRGILGCQTGSLTFCMAFGRPQRSWVQELKSSAPAGFLWVVEAGGRSPGRSLALTTQALTDA